MSAHSKHDEVTTSPPEQKHTLKLIVLSGRSGSGKSSSAFEICHLLGQQKAPHAHIDGDNLDAFYPRSDTSEMMLKNLNSMWQVYYPEIRSVWTRSTFGGKPFVMVLSGTALVLELEGIIEVFARVMRDYAFNEHQPESVKLEVNPVVLEAGDETVESRLRIREIGGELDAHLQSSRRMSRILSGFRSERLKTVRNNGRSVKEVASEILGGIGL